MARQAKPVELDLLNLERRLLTQGIHRIAGVDEAGRGPLAGPVTAAAVVLPLEWLQRGLPSELRGLNDSKQLTAVEREFYFSILTAHRNVEWQVASTESTLIDDLNILRATHQTMRIALARIEPPPQHVLLDGLAAPLFDFPQTPVIKGDALSYSIAAASVIAKVTRDRLMVDYDRLYPGYGFAIHKGYGTPEHLEALRLLGPCPIHRRSFAPIRLTQLELFAHAALVPTQSPP